MLESVSDDVPPATKYWRLVQYTGPGGGKARRSAAMAVSIAEDVEGGKVARFAGHCTLIKYVYAGKPKPGSSSRAPYGKVKILESDVNHGSKRFGEVSGGNVAVSRGRTGVPERLLS